MAKFICLTDKNGSKLAVNIDNVAEFCERSDGKTTIVYCSGNEENALCSIVTETFEEISQKVTNALHWK